MKRCFLYRKKKKNDKRCFMKDENMFFEETFTRCEERLQDMQNDRMLSEQFLLILTMLITVIYHTYEH